MPKMKNLDTGVTTSVTDEMRRRFLKSGNWEDVEPPKPAKKRGRPAKKKTASKSTAKKTSK